MNHRIFFFRRPLLFKNQGFTLVELLVGIVIVGILMSIAIPQYTKHLDRVNRAAARVQLMAAAQFMHRFYAANDRFDKDRSNDDVKDQMPANLQRAPQDGTQLYTLNFTTLTADTFTLSMTPTTGGKMEKDACGSFTLTQAGVKGIKDNDSKISRDTCWQ